MSGKYGLDLRALLLAELEQRLVQLAPEAPEEERRMALHSLRGSAGLAGEKILFEGLTRLDRRLAVDPAEALDAAHALVTEALEALRQGLPVPGATWPEPPPGLAASAPSQDTASFAAAMKDRLDHIDEALADPLGSYETALTVHREVHAMKGAALAVGDEVLAWFCHGLEDQLASVREVDRDGASASAEAKKTLDLMSQWRGMLGEMITSPTEALESLRVRARSRRASSNPPRPPTIPRPPKRPSVEAPGDSDSVHPADPTVRVSAQRLDRLFERVRLLGQAKGTVSAAAYDAHIAANEARSLYLELTEALRLIGPPKPWGAPAAAIRRVSRTADALERMATRMDHDASSLKAVTERVRRETAAAQRELATMRTTKLGMLFARVAAAITAQASREGREVRVHTTGADVPVDRRLTDALVDPVLQLAKNAMSHGLEPPEVRAAAGKPAVGTLSLDAELRGGALLLRVADDGAGVDLPDLRRRAVASNTVTREMAEALDDEALLTLLFVPGFTTRESADLLAGRGVGLDLTLAAIRRLGGTIRLTSRRGEGLSALLRIPVESGLVKVLWMRAGTMWYALPLQHVRRVDLTRDVDGPAPTPLAACLSAYPRSAGVRGSEPRALVVELDRVERAPTFPCRFTVDEVGIVEELAVRGLSALVTTAGPYAGAIVRGDDVRLCLDAHALSELLDRLRAPARAGEGAASERA